MKKKALASTAINTASAGKSGGGSAGEKKKALAAINTASAGESGGPKSVGLNCHQYGVNGGVWWGESVGLNCHQHGVNGEVS